MAVPYLPPPLAQVGLRRFSFYPAILNIEHNEWIYRGATWSDVLVRNTKTYEEIPVPRRYLGEISRVDEPVMIVGLVQELEYKAGVVCSAEHRVIEMPRAVNDSPRPRAPETKPTRAPVVGIRLEDGPERRMAKFVLGGVALGVVGCVLGISLYRGGMSASKVFYAPAMQGELPFTERDDYFSVVRALGAPAEVRWAAPYQLLFYPKHGLHIILMGTTPGEARYIGALDRTWHPVHSVERAGRGNSYEMLRTLKRF